MTLSRKRLTNKSLVSKPYNVVQFLTVQKRASKGSIHTDVMALQLSRDESLAPPGLPETAGQPTSYDVAPCPIVMRHCISGIRHCDLLS